MLTGQMLGHYRVVRELGEGGTAEVHVAEDTKLGRRVVLRLLPSHLAADPERQQRFEREARGVAAFNHPNIVRCLSHSGLSVSQRSHSRLSPAT
jgi:serine/threonine-protein kinase